MRFFTFQTLTLLRALCFLSRPRGATASSSGLLDTIVSDAQSVYNDVFSSSSTNLAALASDGESALSQLVPSTSAQATTTSTRSSSVTIPTSSTLSTAPLTSTSGTVSSSSSTSSQSAATSAASLEPSPPATSSHHEPLALIIVLAVLATIVSAVLVGLCLWYGLKWRRRARDRNDYGDCSSSDSRTIAVADKTEPQQILVSSPYTSSPQTERQPQVVPPIPASIRTNDSARHRSFLTDEMYPVEDHMSPSRLDPTHRDPFPTSPEVSPFEERTPYPNLEASNVLRENPSDTSPQDAVEMWSEHTFDPAHRPYSPIELPSGDTTILEAVDEHPDDSRSLMERDENGQFEYGVDDGDRRNSLDRPRPRRMSETWRSEHLRRMPTVTERDGEIRRKPLPIRYSS